MRPAALPASETRIYRLEDVVDYPVPARRPAVEIGKLIDDVSVKAILRTNVEAATPRAQGSARRRGEGASLPAGRRRPRPTHRRHPRPADGAGRVHRRRGGRHGHLRVRAAAPLPALLLRLMGGPGPAAALRPGHGRRGRRGADRRGSRGGRPGARRLRRRRATSRRGRAGPASSSSGPSSTARPTPATAEAARPPSIGGLGAAE